MQDDLELKLCACDTKRETSLTDGDRSLLPNTPDKINKLLAVFSAKCETHDSLWILGGAPWERTMKVPMITEEVKANFKEVKTVDPRFTVTDEELGIYKGDFRGVSFTNIDNIFSDMYMESGKPDSSGPSGS